MLPNKINYLVRANEIRTNDQLYKISEILLSFFLKENEKKQFTICSRMNKYKKYMLFCKCKSEIYLNKKEFDLWLFYFCYERTLLIVTHKVKRVWKKKIQRKMSYYKNERYDIWLNKQLKNMRQHEHTFLLEMNVIFRIQYI